MAIKRFLVSLALLVLVSLCSLSVFAEGEETADATPEPSATVAVADAALAAKLDAMQETLDKIAAAVASDDATLQPEESAAPDYTEQLSQLSDDVADIRLIVQATPETAASEHVWDKSFNDYTPVEGMLLVGVVLLAFIILLLFLR